MGWVEVQIARGAERRSRLDEWPQVRPAETVLRQNGKLPGDHRRWRHAVECASRLYVGPGHMKLAVHSVGFERESRPEADFDHGSRDPVFGLRPVTRTEGTIGISGGNILNRIGEAAASDHAHRQRLSLQPRYDRDTCYENNTQNALVHEWRD